MQPNVTECTGACRSNLYNMEPVLHTIRGDILACECDIIVHIVDCVSMESNGLATKIIAKYPYADIYDYRECFSASGRADYISRGNPGEIAINIPESAHNPIVIAAFGMYDRTSEESDKLRELWFLTALERLVQFLPQLRRESELPVIGFKYGLGHKHTRRAWSRYAEIIGDFRDRVADEGFHVIIYKKPKDHSIVKN